MDQSEERINLGELRRVTPISRFFGFDRGRPVDRYYIERFLSDHSGDIGGRVLEFAEDSYTRAFGGDRVTRRDVLHPKASNTQATIIADLCAADHVPNDIFDCIICTQTLMYIYQIRTAIQALYRILKPSGVLLVTFPGISQLSREDMDEWGEHWRFTTLSAGRLFEEAFPPANITVKAYGNVLAAISFLHGLAVEELDTKDLDYFDPDYEVLITVRAVKPGSTQ